MFLLGEINYNQISTVTALHWLHFKSPLIPNKTNPVQRLRNCHKAPRQTLDGEVLHSKITLQLCCQSNTQAISFLTVKNLNT